MNKAWLLVLAVLMLAGTALAAGEDCSFLGHTCGVFDKCVTKIGNPSGPWQVCEAATSGDILNLILSYLRLSTLTLGYLGPFAGIGFIFVAVVVGAVLAGVLWFAVLKSIPNPAILILGGIAGLLFGSFIDSFWWAVLLLAGILWFLTRG